MGNITQKNSQQYRENEKRRLKKELVRTARNLNYLEDKAQVHEHHIRNMPKNNYGSKEKVKAELCRIRKEQDMLKQNYNQTKQDIRRIVRREKYIEFRKTRRTREFRPIILEDYED